MFIVVRPSTAFKINLEKKTTWLNKEKIKKGPIFEQVLSAFIMYNLTRLTVCQCLTCIVTDKPLIQRSGSEKHFP